MANRNTQGFGLIPAGTIGSTPSTQGQGKYLIDAGYAVDLFQGTAVKSAAGYIVTAQAAITNTCIGVLNGIFYNDATTKKPTFANFYNQPITPANSEDTTAFVLDNPNQLFVGAIDAAAAQARDLPRLPLRRPSASERRRAQQARCAGARAFHAWHESAARMAGPVTSLVACRRQSLGSAA